MSTDDKRLERFAKLLKGAKTPPPSEDHRAIFHKKLEAEASATRPRIGVPVLSLALVSLVIVLGAFGLMSVGKQAPSAALIQGSVQVQSIATQKEILTKGQTLKEGDEITTGPADWAILELERGYRIKIQPNSILKIQQLKRSLPIGQTTMLLSKGQALIKIGTKLHDKYPLEIQTSNAFAKATGTQFSVMAPSAGMPQSLVSVLQGTVQVGKVSQGLRVKKTGVDVSSGKEAYVSDKDVITPITLVEQKRRDLEEQLQFGRENIFLLILSMSSNRVNELLAPCVVYMRFETDNAELSKVKSSIASLNRAVTLDDPFEHAKAAKDFESAIENQNILDPVSGLLFAGAYYAYLNQPEDALRVFEKVYENYPASSYRSLAMMAIAKLYHETFHDSEKALIWINEILELYPESLESDAAYTLQSEL